MIPQVDSKKYPTAHAMIALWNREWSGTALRWATHRLLFVLNVHGHEILRPDDFDCGKKS